jgi:hypothetical protein
MPRDEMFFASRFRRILSKCGKGRINRTLARICGIARVASRYSTERAIFSLEGKAMRTTSIKSRVAAWAIAVLLAVALPRAAFAQDAASQDAINLTPSLWPMHAFTADGAQVTIFQPQLADYQGDTLTGRAAVAVAPKDSLDSVFGAVFLTSRVSIDRVARTVQILDVNVTDVKFPQADPVSTPALVSAVRQAILSQPIVLPLDHLLESLQVMERKTTAAAELQSKPPKIIFLDHPAMKVEYDGAPHLMLAPNSPLLTAANTPFFVALDPGSKRYFLKGGGRWFSAPDPLGPFGPALTVPAPIAGLADQQGYQDPQTPLPPAQFTALQIITATEPTELIWTDGPAQMATIPGTGLLYIANTNSDVFLEISTQRTFVLLSGRWYVSRSHNGPWTFVPPDQLPADFGRIPADSPKVDVLANVAETQQAKDAVADSYIPQTAAIDRQHFDEPTLEYDGNPSFEAIPGTQCSYAVNTPGCVVQLNGTYYCCDNGVWYQSPTAYGPWQLCTSVPPEIYAIPPECPIYPCTFCSVYGFTPDWVYCGYTPGYVGCYRYRGVVWYGTGYRYRPWVHRRFFGRPHTFGFAARFNAYQNHWGFSFGLGAAGVGGSEWVGHNPRFDGHGGEWFGFGGYRPTFSRNEVVGAGPLATIDRSKRDTFARDIYQGRGDLHREAPGISRIPLQEPRANPAIRGEEFRNNIYADKQGNAYRRTEGGWEYRDQNQWRPGAQDQPQRPAEPRREEPAPPHAVNPYQGLNQDDHARQAGEQRSQPAAPSGGGGGGGGRRR